MSQRNTFPKSFRLKSSRSVRKVFEKGKYLSLGPIGVKYVIGETKTSRFSISVNKKVGNAPFRNKIKRFVREAVRNELSGLSHTYDICFFVTNPPKHSLELAYVLFEIRRFFKKLNHEFKK